MYSYNYKASLHPVQLLLVENLCYVNPYVIYLSIPTHAHTNTHKRLLKSLKRSYRKYRVGFSGTTISRIWKGGEHGGFGPLYMDQREVYLIYVGTGIQSVTCLTSNTRVKFLTGKGRTYLYNQNVLDRVFSYGWN